jgi:hypothetical protein
VLQAVHCDECGGSFLVGIDNKDVRKVPTTGGQLGNDPWVGFDHKDTKNVPWINDGDRIPCPRCNEECIVRDMTPVKGDIHDHMPTNE